MAHHEAENIEFDEIHNLKNMHKSGANDFDVFAAALKQYQESQLTWMPFSYVDAWYELKNVTTGFLMKNRFHPTPNGQGNLNRNNPTDEHLLS